MTTDDISTTAITLSRRPVSHKHRTHSQNHSVGKSGTEECRITRTRTASSRTSSKLPDLLGKVSVYPPTTEAMLFKRYRSPQKDICSSSSSKLEQKPVTINPSARLPTLYSLTSNADQKRMSEFRRRQIYALNHLMRDLEQEQFLEFCKSNTVNIDKQENTDKNDEKTDEI